MFVYELFTNRMRIISFVYRYTWIEIVEPKTNKKMYANMETGETTWRPPTDVE